MIVQQEPEQIANVRAMLMKISFGVISLAAVVVLAWLGMQQVSAAAARAWALVSTLLLVIGLPVALWLGRNYGHAESKGAITGLDMGVSRVSQAAKDTAQLGLQNMREVRIIREQAVQPAAFVLPPIEEARQLDSGRTVEM